MRERVVPSDFAVHGVICPPRICRMITPSLIKSLDEAMKDQQCVDPELMVWIRAVDLEGRRWATNADVSIPNASSDEPPQSDDHAQLTAADLASELGCTPANIRFHVRKGHLTPARRDPMLFDRSELDRYKSRRT
jgi:hypothetical protein